MKTAVTQTSIDAYYSINLTEQQKEVLTAIRVLGETCIADVAAYLGWERSTVSGRMNDLKKQNLLIFAGKRKSETTGITSEFWRVREFKTSLF
jgi:DNA-binding MarR family transcriptional regulator